MRHVFLQMHAWELIFVTKATVFFIYLAGSRCGSCKVGYYRSGGNICAICPNTPPALLVAVLVAILIGLSVALLVMIKLGRYFAAISIAINYFQILYIFKGLFLNWSSSVLQMFEIFSFFSFNIELASPECINPSINYFSKGEFMFMLPPVILFFMTFVSIMSAPPFTYPLIYLKSRIKKQSYIYPQISWDVIQSNMKNSVRAFHILLQFMYVSLTTWALGFFNCYEFGGTYVMTKAPVFECYKGEHLENMPYFTMAVIFYVVGIPLYFSTLYFIIYQTKFKGQFALNLKRLVELFVRSDTSIYKPATQFIVSVQLIMKLVILLVGNFMSDQISSQAVIIQFAIFVYVGFLIYFKPYVQNDHTLADLICQVCSVVTLGCGILFLTNTDNSSSSQRVQALTAIVIATTSACVLCAVVFVAKDLHRGSKLLTEKLVEDKRKSVAKTSRLSRTSGF